MKRKWLNAKIQGNLNCPNARITGLTLSPKLAFVLE